MGILEDVLDRMRLPSLTELGLDHGFLHLLVTVPFSRGQSGFKWGSSHSGHGMRAEPDTVWEREGWDREWLSQVAHQLGSGKSSGTGRASGGGWWLVGCGNCCLHESATVPGRGELDTEPKRAEAPRSLWPLCISLPPHHHHSEVYGECGPCPPPLPDSHTRASLHQLMLTVMPRKGL